MRIIVCSPGYNDKFTAFYYSFDKRFINGLIRLGHSVVHISDRDANRTAFDLPILGTYVASRQLFAVAEAYQPELILLFHADKISDRTLREIKHSNPLCRIINIDCDLIEIDRIKARALRRGANVDATLITSAGISLATLRQAGLRAGYVPNPADSSLDDIGEATSDRHWDMVFLAAAGPNSPKWKLAKAVAASAPDLKVGLFGAGKNRILGRKYYDLLATSKTGLNWSSNNEVHLYSSDRIAQLFGSGLCVCLPRSSGFQRFIPEEEAIYFDGSDDLVRSLRIAVNSGEWIERGRAGHQRYMALFNERRIAQYVIDFALERPLHDYEWGDL